MTALLSALFAVWLAGVFVNVGMYVVWSDRWKVEGESRVSYVIRVTAVFFSSWFGVGVALGRIAEDVRKKSDE